MSNKKDIIMLEKACAPDRHAHLDSAFGFISVTACAVCRRDDTGSFVSELPTSLCHLSGAWLMYRKKYTLTP